MSPLQRLMIISTSLFITILVFEIITKAYDAYRIKHGLAEDQSLKNTRWVKYYKIQRSAFRYIFECSLIILTGVLIVITMMKMRTYNNYGAFYDESWRVPEIEQYLDFPAADTEELNEIYTKDPANFDFDAYKICLVKLGCDDCIKIKDEILALQEYDIKLVFSTSTVGKAYVAEYNINFVPCIIENNVVTNLYQKSEYIPPSQSDIPDINNMADSLLDIIPKNTETTVDAEKPIDAETEITSKIDVETEESSDVETEND